MSKIEENSEINVKLGEEVERLRMEKLQLEQ